MIDNEFQNFPKIDQVQVPASNETMNKIKKTCYVNLKILETGLDMGMFFMK